LSSNFLIWRKDKKILSIKRKFLANRKNFTENCVIGLYFKKNELSLQPNFLENKKIT
jgi:hypothetical protein